MVRSGIGLVMLGVASLSALAVPAAAHRAFDTDSLAESMLQEVLEVAYELCGNTLTVNLASDGIVTMTEQVSARMYSPVRLYGFAGCPFHPETDLVR